MNNAVVELSSPRSVTSSRGSYGLPSPFSSSSMYQGVKSVAVADNTCSSVDATSCSAAASNQPLHSPLTISAVKDDCKQTATLCTAGVR